MIKQNRILPHSSPEAVLQFSLHYCNEISCIRMHYRASGILGGRSNLGNNCTALTGVGKLYMHTSNFAVFRSHNNSVPWFSWSGDVCLNTEVMLKEGLVSIVAEHTNDPPNGLQARETILQYKKVGSSKLIIFFKFLKFMKDTRISITN